MLKITTNSCSCFIISPVPGTQQVLRNMGGRTTILILVTQRASACKCLQKYIHHPNIWFYFN